jgi:hypothetical protein
MVSEWDAFAGNVHLIRTRKPSSPEGNHRRGYQSLFFPSAVEETTRVLCQVAMGCHGAITGCHGLSWAAGCHRLMHGELNCVCHLFVLDHKNFQPSMAAFKLRDCPRAN